MPETTKRCQVEMSDGKPCGREVYDEEKCIFHSNKEDKDLNLFHGELYQTLRDESLKVLDFTRFVFPKGVVFLKTFPKAVTFEEAVFNGDVDFQKVIFQDKADFTGTLFTGKVVFENSGFKSDVIFRSAVFKDRCNFMGGSFKGRALFASARFESAANFYNASFEGGVYFMDAFFGGGVNFQGATIKDEADFFRASFYGESNFVSTEFKGDTSFEDASFSGRANFEHSIFKRKAHFIYAIFEGKTNFRYSSFEDSLLMNAELRDGEAFHGETDFTSVTFSRPEKVEFHKVNVSSIRFIETDVRNVHFTDVDWYRKKSKGRSKVFDEVSPMPKPWHPDADIFDYALIAQLYRRLRANYECNLRYSEAGDFYIGEMEMTRKAQTSIFKKLPLLFYKAISNYGESYYRPLCWISAILVIFPLLFMFAGIQPVSFDPNNPTGEIINYKLDFSSIESFAPTSEKMGVYYKCFLYSMSVFSFIRDKKYTTANNWGHTLFVIESILSPVTLAFFLLALRRRFKR